MKNIEVKVEGTKLTIEVDLTQRFGPSKSGRSDIIAATDGLVEVPGKPHTWFILNVSTRDGKFA